MPRSRWDAARAGAFPIPASETLGFEVHPTDTPEEGVTISWVVPANLCNSAGNLQGGVMAAFADAVLGGATAAYLPEDQYPALAEMKISIFRPAPAGTKLIGKGTILKRGKRVLFAEAEITDADGRSIAKASATEIPADAG
jgi:uncharacterized protein (TIGR00369 family)